MPFENLEPLPRTSLKPEWTFSHKHQIINKPNLNKNSTNANDDSINKGKAKNKNRKLKDVKFTTGERKRDSSDRPMVRIVIVFQCWANKERLCSSSRTWNTRTRTAQA